MPCIAVILAMLLIALFHGTLFAKKPAKKPNIIILLADDMGYGDVGVYGSQYIPTPNMDQLAGEGMTFTDAHSAATCVPTRYALMTGRYYWRSDLSIEGGFGYAASRLEPDFVTLPEFLRDHGYHTGMIGKWHLGLDWGLQSGAEGPGSNGEFIDFSKPIGNGPVDHGFDYYFGIPASLDMPPYVFIENDRTTAIPTLEKEPKNTLQWERGGLMTPGWRDEDVGPTFTEKAKAFIRSHHEEYADRPFFLYFAASAPHTPAVPPEFIKGKSLAGARGDMVVEFDWTVGEMVRLLDELDLKENTIIFVTSDNGALTDGPPHWGQPLDREKYDVDHRGHQPNGVLRGQKADVWEGATRVPFIVRWPEIISPASVSRDLVSLIDFNATTADIIGKREEMPTTAIDSYSIWPVLTGGRMDQDRIFIHHSSRGLFAIRQGSWKLIDGRGSGGFTQPVTWKIQPGEPEGQLYNLDTDLSETRNLWMSHPERVDHLIRLLKDYKNMSH